LFGFIELIFEKETTILKSKFQNSFKKDSTLSKDHMSNLRLTDPYKCSVN